MPSTFLILGTRCSFDLEIGPCSTQCERFAARNINRRGGFRNLRRPGKLHGVGVIARKIPSYLCELAGHNGIHIYFWGICHQVKRTVKNSGGCVSRTLHAACGRRCKRMARFASRQAVPHGSELLALVLRIDSPTSPKISRSSGRETSSRRRPLTSRCSLTLIAVSCITAWVSSLPPRSTKFFPRVSRVWPSSASKATPSRGSISGVSLLARLSYCRKNFFSISAAASLLVPLSCFFDVPAT